jgi:hypothetical protein
MSKEEVIKKIQKLLAMSQANGASENEAMMAASKVQQLLQEHNLSLGEIKDNQTIEDILLTMILNLITTLRELKLQYSLAVNPIEL